MGYAKFWMLAYMLMDSPLKLSVAHGKGFLRSHVSQNFSAPSEVFLAIYANS